MTAHLGADEAVDRARKLLDPRFATIRDLAERRAVLTDARRVLDDAEVADAQAYAAATRAGWTEADLKAVGFDAPERRLPGRPRRKTTGGRTGGETGARAEPGATGDGQQDPA